MQWQRLNSYKHKKMHTFDDFPQLMISRALQNTLNILIYHSKLMMLEYYWTQWILDISSLFQSINCFKNARNAEALQRCPLDGTVAPENLRHIGTVDQTHSPQIQYECKSSRRMAAKSLTPFPLPNIIMTPTSPKEWFKWNQSVTQDKPTSSKSETKLLQSYGSSLRRNPTLMTVIFYVIFCRETGKKNI